MSVEEIGCCGSYCGTCPVLEEQACKGCKTGYENGERNISKAKCKIKVCCINSKLQSCADCNEYNSCNTVNDFYNKNGYKYGKYKQATGEKLYFQLDEKLSILKKSFDLNIQRFSIATNLDEAKENFNRLLPSINEEDRGTFVI